jgi:hypothetical protein
MGACGGVFNTSAAGVFLESAATSNHAVVFGTFVWTFSSVWWALAAPAATLAEALDGEALDFFGTEASPPQPQTVSNNNDRDIVPHGN